LRTRLCQVLGRRDRPPPRHIRAERRRPLCVSMARAQAGRSAGLAPRRRGHAAPPSPPHRRGGHAVVREPGEEGEPSSSTMADSARW
jgi:hypothetical protein